MFSRKPTLRLKKIKMKYNFKLFKRNFFGLTISLFVVYTIILCINHEIIYSIKRGLLDSVTASMILSLCVLIFDPIVKIKIDTKQKLEKLKLHYKNWNKIQAQETFIDESNSLFGDIKFTINDEIVIEGSRFRIKHLLKE